MTTQEFSKTFWPYAVARFGEIDRWLGELPQVARHERDTTQRDVLQAWQGVLSDVAIDDAKRALDAMARGDEDRPKGLSEYPATIRRVARRIRNTQATAGGWSTVKPRPRMIDEEWVYACLSCEDSGMVRVWHPETHKLAREKSDAFVEMKLPGYTCMAVCSCKEGDSFSQLGQRFDASRMVAVPKINQMHEPESRRQLVQILADRDATGQGPYDFDIT